MLKQEYDESQENLGNARLAWKALVRNLKYEEESNKELVAEVKELKEKLERFAVVELLEAREEVVARKEAAVGNVEEYEAVAKACKEEYEGKVDVVRSAEHAVEQREHAVAERERAVSEREAFLLKRDTYFSGKQETGPGVSGRGGEFTDAHAARERASRRGSLGQRSGSGHVRIGSGPIGSGRQPVRRASDHVSDASGSRQRRGSFGSDLSNGKGGSEEGEIQMVGTPQAMRGAMLGGGLLVGAGFGGGISGGGIGGQKKMTAQERVDYMSGGGGGGGGGGLRKGGGFKPRAGVARPVFGR